MRLLLNLMFFLCLPLATFSAEKKIKWEQLFKGNGVIWGIDFLPDGRMIFTERHGKLRILSLETRSAVTLEGVPEVHAVGQGGLLDVKAHPRFAEKPWVYLLFSKKIGELSSTALGRGELKEGKLVGFKEIFIAQAPSENDQHYGSRMAFDEEGFLFVTIGDRMERDRVQDLSQHMGKILRLTEDGKAAPGNPFSGKDQLPEIWSFGHRNPQGLDFDKKTGDLWSSEMGPRGGDEINRITKGSNYGWPLATFGKEYSGRPINGGKVDLAGAQKPVEHWVPSISPSGMIVYRGKKYAGWDGDLFLANLSSQHLRRLVMKSGKVIQQEEFLKKLGHRFRSLAQGPDDLIYAGTDEGIIGRLVPAN